ncbi:MAG: response regulator [Thermodesulfovibrionales bacterium]|nr:response regulator [Thermodesulfovibrionales bacterium]
MQKERALIVDDDPIVRDILADILANLCGFKIYTASNGLEALEVLKNNECDIIFTDLNMPKLGGMDFLKETIKNYPSIPVVMITGISTIDTAVAAMKEGASDFIIKPFQIDKVVSVAQRIIGEKKLLKKLDDKSDQESSIKRINAELFKKLQEINILQSLSLELDGIYNNKDIYEKISDMAKRLLPVKCSFFGLVDGDVIKIQTPDFHKREIKITASLNELVIKRKKYSIISFDGTELTKKGSNDHHEILLIPFTLKDEVFAVLGIYDKADKTSFTEDEIAIIQTFAKKASLRIENNALYEVFYNNLINTLKSLVISIEARDSYTKQHSERVAIYSLQVADIMGLSEEDKDAIRFGGYLHDIGKIGVRDIVLLKPDKLDDEEQKEIRQHPIIGDEIVKPIRFFPKERELIRYHHERFDGKGYPDGLAGDEIPLHVRILSVADAYDAMTSSRPYRPAKSHKMAIEELIKNASLQFDPLVIKAFLQTSVGKGNGYEN